MTNIHIKTVQHLSINFASKACNYANEKKLREISEQNSRDAICQNCKISTGPSTPIAETDRVTITENFDENRFVITFNFDKKNPKDIGIVKAADVEILSIKFKNNLSLTDGDISIEYKEWIITLTFKSKESGFVTAEITVSVEKPKDDLDWGNMRASVDDWSYKKL